MKKILTILILCCIIITSKAQDGTKKIKPASLYGYKNCFGTDRHCPVWYFYNDTGFIYLSEQKGIITQTGIGKWSYATDSSVFIYPSPAPELLQPQHIINYKAEIKHSPDTNYINGKVLRMDGKPLYGGGIIHMTIDNEGMVADVNNDGSFNFKLSRSKTVSGFSARSWDCEDINFVLQPGSNYHHLVISLPPRDTTLALIIATEPFELKFIHNLGRIDDPSKINDLKHWLKDAIIRRPLYKLYFESLLNKLPQDSRD
jgi:hypothetical protein